MLKDDNTPINILFLPPMNQEARDYISDKLNVYKNVNTIFPESREEIIDKLSLIHVMVGRKPELEFLERATSLKLYVYPGTGVDGLLKIIKSYSRKNDIIISNTHRSAYNCAQHAVALLFGIMNRLIVHHIRMKDNQSVQRSPETTLLKNKVIGLFGFGPINKYVFQFLSGFESQFSIIKRSWSKNELEEYSKNYIKSKYNITNLKEFLSEIDILIIGAPLTQETRGIIGFTELKILGNNSFVINVSRGAIINQEALYTALKENIIQGAGIDTWYHLENEPKSYGFSKKYPFNELDNIILSPHRANSGGDVTRWDPVLVNIIKLINGKNDFENVIDLSLEY